MKRKKNIVRRGRNLIINELRRLLIAEMGESGDTCPRKHLAVIKLFVFKKYGVNITTKAEADQWVGTMRKDGIIKTTTRRGTGGAVKRGNNGFSTEYTNYINKSLKWRKIRDAILCRDKNKCIQCGSKKNLHVHHLTYDHLFHEEEHPRDLATLCKACHGNLHASPLRGDMNKELAGIIPLSPEKISLVFTEEELAMARASAKRLDRVGGDSHPPRERIVASLRGRHNLNYVVALLGEIRQLKSIGSVRGFIDDKIAELTEQ